MHEGIQMPGAYYADNAKPLPSTLELQQAGLEQIRVYEAMIRDGHQLALARAKEQAFMEGFYFGCVLVGMILVGAAAMGCMIVG